MDEEDNLSTISRDYLLNQKNILVDYFIKLFEFNCNLNNPPNINTFYIDLQKILTECITIYENEEYELYPGLIVDTVKILEDLSFNNQITIGNYINIFESAFNIYLQRDATPENNIDNDHIFRRRKYGSINRLINIFVGIFHTRSRFLDDDN